MNHLIPIAVGGGMGAVMRYLASTNIHRLVGRDFPYGTLSVNVMGSLFMGFLYIILIERSSLSTEWRAFLMIGLLGAFTTFSTFSIETLNLLESGELLKAASNILLSVLLCLIAAWLGLFIGRQL
jgi:CrcB protein